MKSTVLSSLLFLLTAAITHAQLSILPQVGFEQSRTTINYGDASSSAFNGNFKAGVKADYRFKGGFGPFIGVSTSPAPVSIAFTPNGTLSNAYEPATSSLQFRVEAGYQFTSRPIQFGKRSFVSANKISSNSNSYSGYRRNCGQGYRSRCGERRMSNKNIPANTGLNMRLQPAIALAYVPSGKDNIQQTANGFEYNSAWKTAIVPSMGFQFAKGQEKLFTLTLFYTKPLNQNEETIAPSQEFKSSPLSLSSKASTWGFTVGVPFSFSKAAKNKVQQEQKPYTRTPCTRVYHGRCSRL